jgi:hypothetical protein
MLKYNILKLYLHYYCTTRFDRYGHHQVLQISVELYKRKIHHCDTVISGYHKALTGFINLSYAVYHKRASSFLFQYIVSIL